MKAGNMPITEIARTLGCSRRTVYNVLAQGQAGKPEAPPPVPYVHRNGVMARVE